MAIVGLETLRVVTDVKCICGVLMEKDYVDAGSLSNVFDAKCPKCGRVVSVDIYWSGE